MKNRLSAGNHTRDYYSPHKKNKSRKVFLLVMIVLIVVLLFSAFMLVQYVVEFFSSRRVSNELRQLNQQALQMEMAQMTPVPAATPAPSAQPVIVHQVVHNPAPSPTPAVMLQPMRYPTNYYAIVSSRFKTIQSQNKDIIGWLTIPNVLDEAVVQRDNEYYLRRDYRGYHNQNGAIFLDETVNLQSRPYTMTLYGHNMKTGAMFGALRNYENANFYHKNAFFTFDTAYENGRYVIFAVSTVSTLTGNSKYVNFAKLNSSTIAWRQEAIDQLIGRSVYNCAVDVRPDDQLLLLMTCVDDTTERRVIAARRVRDGESEIELQKMVSHNIPR